MNPSVPFGSRGPLAALVRCAPLIVALTAVPVAVLVGQNPLVYYAEAAARDLGGGVFGVVQAANRALPALLALGLLGAVAVRRWAA
ncbi:hypothetical protein, partial [Actinocorallia lasiicapitis]